MTNYTMQPDAFYINFLLGPEKAVNLLCVAVNYIAKKDKPQLPTWAEKAFDFFLKPVLWETTYTESERLFLKCTGASLIEQLNRAMKGSTENIMNKDQSSITLQDIYLMQIKAFQGSNYVEGLMHLLNSSSHLTGIVTFEHENYFGMRYDEEGLGMTVYYIDDIDSWEVDLYNFTPINEKRAHLLHKHVQGLVAGYVLTNGAH